MKKHFFGAILAITCASSFAATASSTLTMSTTIDEVCSLTDATVMFGTYNPNDNDAKTSTGFLNVQCTANTAYTVTLPGWDGNMNGSGPHGGGQLSGITITQNSGPNLGMPWDNTNGFTGYGMPFMADQLMFTVSIPPHQYSAAGAYTKTQQIRVTY